MACLEWLLEGGTFEECRRAQCPKVVPCTLEGCGRPRLDKRVADILTLHETCANRRALPEDGGVLDQPADITYLFQAIDRTIEQHRQTQREREQLEWQTSRRT